MYHHLTCDKEKAFWRRYAFLLFCRYPSQLLCGIPLLDYNVSHLD